jgi:hypothetical protein
MARFDPMKAFKQIRAERNRQKQAYQEWAKCDRENLAAYFKRSAAINQLMNVFPREGRGTITVEQAAALMVEFAETLPAEWVEARVQFVSKRLDELSVEAVPDAILKEIMLNLLLLAKAADHLKVAEILGEALRGDPHDVESFRNCLANWLVDKVVDRWPPLPEELKPRTEVSEEEEVPQACDAKEEWLPASQAVERVEQLGYPFTVKWLTQDARKHGVRIRRRQLPGRHKKEVEWASLAAYLLEQPRPEKGVDEEVSDRIREAHEQKRRERPLD